MKITRTGAYRNVGETILVDEDLSKHKDHWPALSWSSDKHELTITVRSKEGRSTHDYELGFRIVEVFHFLDLAVPSLTKDSASRAVCVGAIASLRELLAPKETPTSAKV